MKKWSAVPKTVYETRMPLQRKEHLTHEETAQAKLREFLSRYPQWYGMRCEMELLNQTHYTAEMHVQIIDDRPFDWRSFLSTLAVTLSIAMVIYLLFL